MGRCKKCGSYAVKKIKTERGWTGRMVVTHYACTRCGNRFAIKVYKRKKDKRPYKRWRYT